MTAAEAYAYTIRLDKAMPAVSLESGVRHLLLAVIAYRFLHSSKEKAVIELGHELQDMGEPRLIPILRQAWATRRSEQIAADEGDPRTAAAAPPGFVCAHTGPFKTGLGE
jgi:hypothetical protein